MSLLQMEQFATNPDWSRISERHLARAQELVSLIQSQLHLSRLLKTDEYYGWIMELKRMLDD
ncbi:MAG: hypothetical protein HC851_17385 [Acaryochloris sp. RU_4_1]|nr:hypothetical protein [Acaryochloris sp. RU_4_1]NJR56845.1 hypothetical protein [Acaryochloris sp. CRU_2_0]